MIIINDVGWFNTGPYHHCMMACRKSHLDKMKQSCAEGGQLPIGGGNSITDRGR